MNDTKPASASGTLHKQQGKVSRQFDRAHARQALSRIMRAFCKHKGQAGRCNRHWETSCQGVDTAHARDALLQQ